jgi:hypothetical protein
MTLYALPPQNPTAGAQVTPTVPYTPTPIERNIQTGVSPVRQTVEVTPVPTRSDLLTTQAEWSWQEFRDYVVSQIESLHGPFPRDSRKEYGIFNRFLTAYGQEGIAVARYAFEVCGGWWNSAPISINRFAKGSDPYFVLPILERLRD